MSYLVLARKYRPQTFAEVVGQEHVTRTLTNAITAKRVHHAVLFSGPRGNGKTTIARILAKAMNCEKGPTATPCNHCSSCVDITSGNAADVFEIDGASNNSVDQVRELRENIRYMPAHSRHKIYIIDEVHMLSIAAFNALLKTLEEPPSHVMFFFATTEPHKIPLTILSRCQRHDFRRLDPDTIVRHLKMLCEKEGFSADTESLAIVAGEADGCMRDALSLLDQLMACMAGDLNREKLVELLGIVDRKLLLDISDAVFKGNIPVVIEIINTLYARGHDIKKLYQVIVGHFRNLLVVKMGRDNADLVDLAKSDIDHLADQVRDIPLVYINQVLGFLFDLDGAMRHSEQPKLLLDVAFIRLMNIAPVLPIDTLIARIDDIKNSGINPGVVTLANLPERQGQHHLPQPVPQPGTLPTATASPEHYGHDNPAPEIQNLGGEGDDEPDEEEDISSGPRYTGSESPAEAWDRIHSLIAKKSPPVAAALKNSCLRDLNTDPLEIEVSNSSFNLKRIQQEKNLSVIASACETYFSKPVKVAILGNDNQARIRRQKSEEKKIKEDALNHPLISEAIEIFKGRVIEIKLLKDD